MNNKRCVLDIVGFTLKSSATTSNVSNNLLYYWVTQKLKIGDLKVEDFENYVVQPGKILVKKFHPFTYAGVELIQCVVRVKIHNFENPT